MYFYYTLTLLIYTFYKKQSYHLHTVQRTISVILSDLNMLDE